MKNKLYLVSQDFNSGYDTFDSFVMSHSSESEARATHPRGEGYTLQELFSYSWCTLNDKEKLKVVVIGETDIEAGTILIASFNAG